MAGHKQQYVFNERAVAEKIIKNGFTNGIVNGREALPVAKYYRSMFGLGKTKLERKIISFCQEKDPDFNPILEADSISKWVNDAMNYELHDSKDIKITHSEMKEIKKIKKLEHRKILFICLVLSKSIRNPLNKSDKYYLHYGNLAQVCSMHSKKMKETDLEDIMADFIKSDLLYPYVPEKESILIKFATDKGAVAMLIKDPSKCLENYRAFFGGDIEYCANECGNEIVKTTTKKYCDTCAKEKEKERLRKVGERRKKNRTKLPASSEVVVYTTLNTGDTR